MIWASHVPIFAVTCLDTRKDFADGHKMETSIVSHVIIKYQPN
jgi:hypothetical protein